MPALRWIRNSHRFKGNEWVVLIFYNLFHNTTRLFTMRMAALKKIFIWVLTTSIFITYRFVDFILLQLSKWRSYSYFSAVYKNRLIKLSIIHKYFFVSRFSVYSFTFIKQSVSACIEWSMVDILHLSVNKE